MSSQRLTHIGASFVLAASVAIFSYRSWPSAGSGSVEAAVRAAIGDAIPLEGAATLGHSSAKVGLIEFGTFTCVYCREFAISVLPRIKAAYIDSGRVLFAFRQAGGDPADASLALAASCAARQGRYWEMHDALFRWRGVPPRSLAAETGVAQPDLDRCLDDRTAAEPSSATAAARRLALPGTPTFVLGRVSNGTISSERIIVGVHPFEAFSEALDGLLR
jgi:protein-disulfide isomerase